RHFLGLVRDGGVHAQVEHLKALCRFATEAGVPRIAIHAFTDGRDTDPKGGLHYIEDLEKSIANSPAFLASVTGRYYAMDRDKRWERVKVAYDALTKGIGEHSQHVLNDIAMSYTKGITDEFILPIIAVDETGEPKAVIAENDIVICFNFRTDRCREITEVLSQQNFPEWQMTALPLHFVTLTEYDATFKNVAVVFQNDNLKNTIGQVIETAGKKQIRIAETEKYPHVTFFFSGGREQAFDSERRIMIPSPKDVATYDLKP